MNKDNYKFQVISSIDNYHEETAKKYFFTYKNALRYFAELKQSGLDWTINEETGEREKIKQIALVDDKNNILHVHSFKSCNLVKNKIVKEVLYQLAEEIKRLELSQRKAENKTFLSIRIDQTEDVLIKIKEYYNIPDEFIVAI